MKGMDAILIFDIGKTNKKCFLFDTDFKIIEQEQSIFPEISDEDGFPCDDIEKIRQWILEKFEFFTKKYRVIAVNFSTYGASFVHLDEENKVLTPLYNYLKPFDSETEKQFFKKYGPVAEFEIATASPYMGFLNSGLQLFWLKINRKDVFSQIQKSLHFPQYCSFLISGKAFSDYTSIGCHTALWNYKHKQYHSWVQQETLDSLLPPITGSKHVEMVDNVKVGAGIHDSSAALVPYLLGVEEKFVVISTGTWSISMNPFSEEPLTEEDLKKDCLQFMQIDGKPLKAARLFLGKEHEIQTNLLDQYFEKPSGYFKTISFDFELYKFVSEDAAGLFKFEQLRGDYPVRTDLSIFASYEEAYHRLVFELVLQQIASLQLAIGNTQGIETVFVDGGFSNNPLFVHMLADLLPEMTIKRTELASGSALGAAIVVEPDRFNPAVFERVLRVEQIRNV